MKLGPAISLPVLVVVFFSCDGGLEPPAGILPPLGAFSGLITFRNWDAADSLYDLRLVAFTVFPPGDIVSEVLQGRAVVHPPLQGGGPLASMGTDSLRYTVVVLPNTYVYVVVAQQFGPDVYSDWRPVGQYDLDSVLTEPSNVVVPAETTIVGVDMTVDFANPPPPP